MTDSPPPQAQRPLLSDQQLAVIFGQDAKMTGVSTDSMFRARLAAHGARVRRLKAKISPRFVENRDHLAYTVQDGALPDLVLVGDNPGRREWENAVYLCVVGRAGCMAHRFFDVIYGASSFRSKVMVLNKSSFHTPRTTDLTQFLRNTPENRALAEVIRADMCENAYLLADSVALLGIPVVTIGMESGGAVFQSFRHSLESRYRELAQPGACFRGRELAEPFRKVPHFSLSKIFCRNADEAWNAMLEQFLSRHERAIPGLRTANGNVSSKILLSVGTRQVLLDYLETVIIGGGVP